MTIDPSKSSSGQQQQQQQLDKGSSSSHQAALQRHPFPRHPSEQARTNGMLPLQQQQQQQHPISLLTHGHNHDDDDDETPRFSSNNNPLLIATKTKATTAASTRTPTTTITGNNNDNDLTTSLLPPSATAAATAAAAVDNHNIINTTTSSSSSTAAATTTTTTTTTQQRRHRLFLRNRNHHRNHNHPSSSSSSLSSYRRRIRQYYFVQMDSSIRAIRQLGHYLAYMTLLTMLIVLPVVLYNALHDRKLDLAAYNSAWVMVCGTIILSVRLVYLHLTHWYMPAVQKYVVRIVWMVPLYATQSYLSLRFHQARIYIDSVRDFYEAYVIASFVYYLMELLGGQDALVELLRHKAEVLTMVAATATSTTTTTTSSSSIPQHEQQQQGSSTTATTTTRTTATTTTPATTTTATTTTPTTIGQHVFPLNLILEPWELGLEFTLQCKHGVLQYVVFKSVATVLTFVCESAGIYGEGKFDWFVAYPYICFLQNLSVMYALYCLVMLYQAVEQELRYPINWRPLGKFLCVKAVVFFCWWQGVLIFYLRAHGIIEDLGNWTSEEVANGLIDYCIVIEMVGFAIAHSYTFTYKEYLPSNLPPHEQTVENHHSDVTASLLLSSSSTTTQLQQQEQHDAEAATMLLNNNGNTNDTTTRVAAAAAALYRPPATLPQPMKFKDAFWSSTVPKETIQDIQRLRNDFLKGSTTGSNRSNHSLNNDDDNDHLNNNDTSTRTLESSAPPSAITMQDLSSSSRRQNDDKMDDSKKESPQHGFV